MNRPTWYSMSLVFLLLGLMASEGCGSKEIGTAPRLPPPPSRVNPTVVLTFEPGSLTVRQGDSASFRVKAAQTEGFTAPVGLRVSSPGGLINVSVHDVVVSGLVTTAWISFAVRVSTPPGPLKLDVVADGTVSGPVTISTSASVSLTVTEGPPAIGLVLESSLLGYESGTNQVATIVGIDRYKFDGAVGLSVTGLPPGVTAAFEPVSTVGSSSLLILNLPPAFNGRDRLDVRGSGVGVEGAVGSFDLAIFGRASFDMTMDPTALTLAPGQDGQSVVTLVRTGGFTRKVEFSIANAPATLVSVFRPDTTSDDGSVLDLRLGSSMTPGTYALSVVGGSVESEDDYRRHMERAATLTLNVLGSVAGDFSLATSPTAMVTLGRGLTTKIPVRVERSGGNASHVALTSAGAMPYGMSLTFASPDPTGGSVLSISTNERTPGGTYPIVIHGNSYPLPEHVVKLDLVVPPFGSDLTSSPKGTAARN